MLGSWELIGLLERVIDLRAEESRLGFFSFLGGF